MAARGAETDASGPVREDAEAAVVGEGAAVLDHGDPGRAEGAREFGVADAELQPHDPGAHGQDLGDML